MERLTNVQMREDTSMKTGGAAAEMIIPEDAGELQSIVRELWEKQTPYVILGNGSNTLVTDAGYSGTVIKMDQGMSGIRTENDRIICGAGALMKDIARAALESGLAGFEFASGIPGSIGGAVFMNAGAYDGEMKNIVETVSLLSSDGQEVNSVSAEQMDFGYRHSRVQETGEIVLSVTLKLEKGERKAISERMEELARRRKEKQPWEYPSAGSFFKRPEGYFAGKLIDDAGLRGMAVGGAQVSEQHCGFIINRDHATTSDIIDLMHLVQNTVYDKFGVRLEPEVRIIGD